jgi:hypothetical protein
MFLQYDELTAKWNGIKEGESIELDLDV